LTAYFFTESKTFVFIIILLNHNLLFAYYFTESKSIFHSNKANFSLCA